jgi:CRISPR/Cas system CSM-associated protein Csm2 small subunit
MNNSELFVAIESAYTKLSAAKKSWNPEEFEIYLEHMKMLLAEQKKRALKEQSNG